jgi:hypothetical protein
MTDFGCDRGRLAGWAAAERAREKFEFFVTASAESGEEDWLITTMIRGRFYHEGCSSKISLTLLCLPACLPACCSHARWCVQTRWFPPLCIWEAINLMHLLLLPLPHSSISIVVVVVTIISVKGENAEDGKFA